MRSSFILLFLLPAISHSQKIKFSGYDKYLKEMVVETTNVVVKPGSNYTALSFKSVGSNYFVTIKGLGAGANTIGSEDKAILLLDNDSTVVLRSVGIQPMEMLNDQAIYRHEYAVSKTGLQALSQHNLMGIRKYHFRSYVDINIPEKNNREARVATTLLLSELAKVEAAAVKTIALHEVDKYVGDSVTVSGRIFTTRYMQHSQNKPTLMNMGAAYPNQLLTLVIYEDDRANFMEGPETFYLDTEVAVSGKIVLYNDKPQIVLHKKEQIKLIETQAKKSF